MVEQETGAQSPSNPLNGNGCSPANQALEETDVETDLQTLSTLANKTRYKALRLIAQTENGVCGCHLEPTLDVSQGAVSQALTKLHSADLVDRRSEGRWRYYTATPRAQNLLTVLDETRSSNNE